MEFLMDRNLTLQAKAIYAYLLQESEGKKEFQIKSSEVRKALGIGDYQYHSHLRKLIDYGYIRLDLTRDEKKRYNGYKCTIMGGNK